LVDLDLDRARGDVRVHGLGRAGDHLADGAHDELRADPVRGLCGSRRALGVDDELDDPGVVAEVDKDEAAVIAPARDPAGDRDSAADVVRTEVAAVEVTPPVHPEILSTSSSSCAVQSSRPGSRTVARLPSTITVQPACNREAWPSWPFWERPA